MAAKVISELKFVTRFKIILESCPKTVSWPPITDTDILIC